MSGVPQLGQKFNIDSAIIVPQEDVDAAHRVISRYGAHDLDAMLGFAEYEGANTRRLSHGAAQPVTRRPQFTPSGDAA